MTSAPVDNEGLTDKEQHSGNLGNREEAPDGGLLHQVVGDEGSQDGAGKEEEASLDDHALLLVQSEERGEHKEGVDASTHHKVAGVSHGDGPAKVNHGLGLEGAEGVSTEPFSGLVV